MRVSKRYIIKVGVQVHFRGNNTFHNLLVALGTRILSPKSGVIYQFKCTQVGCNEKSGRTFGKRLEEHLRAPPPTGHYINVDILSIVATEAQGVAWAIKEAIFIRVNDPSLNRNLGKYQLPHIWDEVLQDTPTLHLRQPSAATPQWTQSPMAHIGAHTLFTTPTPWVPFFFLLPFGTSFCQT